MSPSAPADSPNLRRTTPVTATDASGGHAPDVATGPASTLPTPTAPTAPTAPADPAGPAPAGTGAGNGSGATGLAGVVGPGVTPVARPAAGAPTRCTDDAVQGFHLRHRSDRPD